MDIKQAREELKALDIKVPRSNSDVAKLFRETFPDVELDFEDNVIEIKKEDLQAIKVYTYVGTGHEPPPVINFMGLQPFTRGVPVEVTNPKVLAKIKNHKSFVKGKVSPEMIIRQDEMEKEIYNRKVRENQIIQNNAKRLMSRG